jgi:hypothetical protein
MSAINARRHFSILPYSLGDTAVVLTRTTRDDPSGAHASETFCPYLLNELVDRSTSANRVVGYITSGRELKSFPSNQRVHL